jgi:hypothetical protein
MMKKVIEIILMFSFLISCMGNKKLLYINQCREKLLADNEKFYLTNPIELKENLHSTDNLFYIGSDSAFHYFKYYTESPIKTGMSFKIKIDEFIPQIEIVFKEGNTLEDGYKFPVSDL